MYKIAISGKANSGKDTVAKLLTDTFCGKHKRIALADPIKEIIRIMFPRTTRSDLYGPSKNRARIIPGAFLKYEPLTYRKLLQNLGTEVGREYKQSIWLDVLDYKAELAEQKQYTSFIVTDVRFRNEFDHLKKLGYATIRLIRDEQLKLNHSSEVEQESIKDEEFDYIIHNNGTKDDLLDEVNKIWMKLENKYI